MIRVWILQLEFFPPSVYVKCIPYRIKIKRVTLSVSPHNGLRFYVKIKIEQYLVEAFAQAEIMFNVRFHTFVTDCLKAGQNAEMKICANYFMCNSLHAFITLVELNLFI